MRVLGLIALGSLFSACMSVGEPSATASPSPTPSLAPTLSATAAPTATASQTPTDTGPTPTRDPNATPTPTPIDLLPFLTAEITVVNLGAQPLVLRVTALDPESDGEYEIGVFELQPEQVTAQLIPPARFRLDFTLGGSDLATCTIDVGAEEQIQFAAIEAGVVIIAGATEPDDPVEMVVASASRCRAGEAS